MADLDRLTSEPSGSELDDYYERNGMLSPRCWAAVAVLVFAQAVAALGVIGIARASGSSVTLRLLQQAPREVSDLDEDDAVRAARMEELAEAIDAATPHLHERALLYTQGSHESQWAAFVHLDLPRCSEGHKGWCDSGRAFSPWQLHGTTRTEDMAWAAAKALAHLRYQAKRCKRPDLTTDAGVRAAISGYATGGKMCSWKGAGERVQTWRRVLAAMGRGA